MKGGINQTTSQPRKKDMAVLIRDLLKPELDPFPMSLKPNLTNNCSALFPNQIVLGETLPLWV
jgi:hypothetical protein